MKVAGISEADYQIFRRNLQDELKEMGSNIDDEEEDGYQGDEDSGSDDDSDNDEYSDSDDEGINPGYRR